VACITPQYFLNQEDEKIKNNKWYLDQEMGLLTEITPIIPTTMKTEYCLMAN